MGSHSDFQIHSASDSGANISHAVVVLPMSPLPWKRCIRGSGKAGCPLLIERQGGRSLCFSPRLPCIFLLRFCLLFSSLHSALALTVCVKTQDLQLCHRATCWIDSALSNRALHSNAAYILRHHTQASAELKGDFCPDRTGCSHRAHSPRAAFICSCTHLSINCAVCHPWLQESLAGVWEDSALFSPLRAHVQNCMTWPFMASIQARPYCVCIPGKWESERWMMPNGASVKKGGLGSGDRTIYPFNSHWLWLVAWLK